MSVVLALRADQTAQDLGEMLTKMEEDGVLTQLDKILQEKHLSGTVALRGVCLGFDDDGVAWRFGKTPVGTVSTLGEQYDRWDELVRRKMPHSNRRGLLTTVHNAHEHIIWRRKMKRYDIKAVEQKNVTGEEVQGQDDETHQGGMD
ncbi:uncharacterized protein B0H18DRAFT_95406 [Fomitopsis serialis]|uniref:uncharacterized protein n=1 Tax=Fomitopsis serialis TaxID=139415 RepID=UPI002008B40D|nr:uncharacterized protein B0H18DRAFT_95406 [Neoantrodia serialis]KAH9915541.1 hypothetical protein B0H18DRAFT_95406 [Neoantrodia serialis]